MISVCTVYDGVAMDAQDWLDRVFIDPAVMELRPDYTAVIIVAEALRPGPSDDASDTLLATAEAQARKALTGAGAAGLPPVAAWRQAYQAFGAKPKRTRPSVEALLRRVDAGLPRIDRPPALYNPLSVPHLLPLASAHLHL